MKKLIYKSIPFLSLLFVACSTDDLTTEDSSTGNVVVEESDSELRHIIFSASADSDDPTRGVIQNDGKIHWSEDDNIKVFNRYYRSGNDNSKVFSISEEDGAKQVSGINAVFAGDLTTSNNYNNYIAAVYPSDGLTVNYNTNPTPFSVTSVTASGKLPSVQVNSTMDAKYQFMTARTVLAAKESMAGLQFKNVISWIKVSVKSSTAFPISRIKFVANSSDFKAPSIAGDFTVTIADNGTPTVSNVTDGSSFVEAYNAGKKLADGDYYFAVLPSASSYGMTLLIEDVANNKAYQRTKTGFKFERNQIYDFGSFDMADENVSSKVLTNVVDLGLPSGTLWSRFNISDGSAEPGSSSMPTFVSDPTTAGGFYAWAEIATKEEYIWGSRDRTKFYKYGAGASIKILPDWITGNDIDNTFSDWAQGYLSRYNSSTSFESRWFDNDSRTTRDNQTTLASDDDVAYLVNSRYCIPTWNQANELLNGVQTGTSWGNPVYDAYTTISRSGSSNNYVYTITGSKSGYTNVSIQLPAKGYMNVQSVNSGNNACYWTCDRSDAASDSYMANRFDLSGSNTVTIGGVSRAQGRLIRPVVVNANIRVMKTYNQLIGR